MSYDIFTYKEMILFWNMKLWGSAFEQLLGQLYRFLALGAQTESIAFKSNSSSAVLQVLWDTMMTQATLLIFSSIPKLYYFCQLPYYSLNVAEWTPELQRVNDCSVWEKKSAIFYVFPWGRRKFFKSIKLFFFLKVQQMFTRPVYVDSGSRENQVVKLSQLIICLI